MKRVDDVPTTTTTTIYVVTSGSYSDYRIEGVFSTPEKADEFCGRNKSLYADVEEWVLDEREGDEEKTVWSCYLGMLSGEVRNEWGHKESCKKRFTETGGSSATVLGNNTLVFGRSSVSAGHARKLAVEKRQEVLRDVTMYEAMRGVKG